MAAAIFDRGCPWHYPLGRPIFNGPAMTDPQARLATALADRSTIQRELGAGGMATVYLAEDLKHRRKVAVKVLRPDLAAALGPERFLREVTIAANLQHPHVLPLYDSGQADGFLYYVMPFVDRVSPRQKLVREGELPIPDAVRILRDVADAMAYAHSQGVVHRMVHCEGLALVIAARTTTPDRARALSEAFGAPDRRPRAVEGNEARWPTAWCSAPGFTAIPISSGCGATRRSRNGSAPRTEPH